MSSVSRSGQTNHGSSVNNGGLRKLLSDWGLIDLWNSFTGSGQTTAEKESASLDARLNNELAQQDYDRKIDFYQRFESPEAQVRQYKAAGINPMTVFGNGASVSASGGVGSGTVSSGSGTGSADLASLLSPLLGFAARQKEIQNQYDIASMQQGLDARNLRLKENQFEWDKVYQKTMMDYYQSRTAGQDLQNSFYAKAYPINLDNLRLTGQKLIQDINTSAAQEALNRAGIDKTQAETYVKYWEATIKQIEAEYAAEYHQLQNELMGLQVQYQALVNQGLSIENSFKAQEITARINKINEEIANLAEKTKYTEEQAKYLPKENRRQNWKMALQTVDCIFRSAGTILSGGLSQIGNRQESSPSPFTFTSTM